MSSKMIFDCPEILDEGPLLTLSQAAKLWPTKVSRASLERYVRSGVRGTRLETVLVCGQRWTTEAAVSRFIHAQLRTEPERATPTQGHIPATELNKKCKKYGLE